MEHFRVLSPRLVGRPFIREIIPLPGPPISQSFPRTQRIQRIRQMYGDTMKIFSVIFHPGVSVFHGSAIVIGRLAQRLNEITLPLQDFG